MQARIIFLICLGLVLTCHSQQAENPRGRHWLRDELRSITERLETVEETGIKQNEMIKEIQNYQNYTSDFESTNEIQNKKIQQLEQTIIKQENEMKLLKEQQLRPSQEVRTIINKQQDIDSTTEVQNKKMQQLEQKILKQENEMKLLKEQQLRPSQEVRTIVNNQQDERRIRISEMSKLEKKIADVKNLIDTVNGKSVQGMESLDEKIYNIEKKYDQIQYELDQTMESSIDTELKKIKDELDRINKIVKIRDPCKLKGPELARTLAVGTRISEDGYWKAQGYTHGYLGEVEAITGDLISIRWDAGSTTNHDVNDDIYNKMKFEVC